ncbi:AfsR/SARP family transcriptional regulator [Kitasatospora sp. CB02891]|uniref:AfsR/SARP family transcriptional regulator n=1 Tax=Kitasatospora sp. CB02891 TaxID=2020329 RepID=UPI000C277D6D|nr:AfsR/SARP family transcriptional regulator [Kitasatospora sp. CB02891]PJN22200.1 transcriptional regulator [Kitasatospora sp. CB02891]
MDARIEFGLLGPLSVTADGRRTAVGGPRQRTILALLLLSPDSVVSVDAMVEAVWQGVPPATARTQVAICVAGLRKVFRAEGCGDGLITTVHPGYQLNSAGHRIDLLVLQDLVQRAEQAVGGGRTAEAAACYERALELWRGPVLEGVTGRQVEDETARLEEVRMCCQEALAELNLALGRNLEVIGSLAAAVREQPLRERARHILMRAQYLAGRRAEALETFREGRRQSVEELGLEPGAALLQLHDAILRDDPALAPPEDGPPPAPLPAIPLPPAPAAGSRPTPFFLPPNVPAFTGRAAETATLDRLLEGRAEEQPPGIGLITGVPGVGKTGLAVHWSHRVAARFPDARLYVDLCGHDGTREPTTAADVLSRFLRALGVPSEQIPADTGERTELYRSLLAGRRALVVLDNARDAAQVDPLLPGTGQCCVIVTGRQPMEQLMLRYGAVRVQLGMLPPGEAVELLGRIVPEDRVAADPEQAERLAELCDRLPLALRIAAARLASKPHWSVPHLVARLADERRRLDELSQGESQVRAGFAVSYRQLAPDAARLYRRLALLEAPDVTVWTAAALVDVHPFEAEQLLEHLVDVQLLEVTGTDGTGRLRFRQQNLLALFARERAAAEDSEDERTQSLHRALRGYLTVAEHAHRVEYGGDFALIHGSAPRLELDALLLEELTADPLEWFEAERLSLVAAIDQAARLGLDELAWDLLGCTVVLFRTREYLDDWQDSCDRALAATRAAGNLRGEAAVLESLGERWIGTQYVSAAAEPLLRAQALFEQIGEEHGRALAVRSLAVLDRVQGDPTSAGARLAEAVELFRAAGDLSCEAHVLGFLAQGELDLGRPDAALTYAEQAVAVARRIGETGVTAQVHFRYARVLSELERFADAERELQVVLRVVMARRDLLGSAHARLGLGETMLRRGRAAEAHAELLIALDLVGRCRTVVAEGRVGVALGRAAAALGRTDEARERLNRAAELLRAGGAERDLELAERELSALGPAAGEAPGGDIGGV